MLVHYIFSSSRLILLSLLSQEEAMAIQRLLLSVASASALLLAQRAEATTSCPAICSTPTIYGFNAAGAGAFCECKSTADSLTIASSGEIDCVCRQCFLQEDSKVVSYDFQSDGTCPPTAVDCCKSAFRACHVSMNKR